MSRVRIRFRLLQDDGYPPVGEETVWAEASECGQLYTLDNIPFFIVDATLGDRVSVIADFDRKLWFRSVVSRSGNSLIRLVFFKEEYMGEVRSNLVELGCSIEVLLSRSMFAVSVPPECDLSDVQACLVHWSEKGVLDYEEALLRH